MSLAMDDIFAEAMGLQKEWKKKKEETLKIELKKAELSVEMKGLENIVYSEVSQEVNDVTGKALFSNSDARKAETDRRLVEDNEEYSAIMSAWQTFDDQVKQAYIDIEDLRVKVGLHKAYMVSGGGE